MTTTHMYYKSPIGTLLLTAESGLLSGLLFDVRATKNWVLGAHDASSFTAVVDQLKRYFEGTLTHFSVPLAQNTGTVFQRKVWNTLLQVPYGQTWSYGTLAKTIGQPTASRAVGMANGKNPISIIVPCHRVIGANGTLTGYGGGLHQKAWLLDHEAKHATSH